MKKNLLFITVAIISFIYLTSFDRTPTLKAATSADSSTLDGEWSMKEKFCVNASTGKTCGSTKFDITITDGIIYVDGEEAGSATLDGDKVSFEYNSDYLTPKFENLFSDAGFDVTIEGFTMTKYAGKLKNNRMNGKIKGSVDVYFNLFKQSTTLNYSGDFKGKIQ